MMFKKSLLIFISIFFTLSALEVEIGEAKQTFCDEYDTYIPSKPISVKKTKVSDFKGKNLKTIKKRNFENRFCDFYSSDKINLKSSRVVYINKQNPHPPYTILLQKTELRI